MKLLITGADGQLGQALQAALTAHEIVALGRDRLDVTSLSEVDAAVAGYRPDLTINAAAWTHVDGAESDAAGAWRVNAVGPRNLAIATARHGLPLMHVSTDYVFDGLGGRPYHEYDATAPQSVYGQSKLAGEHAVSSLNPRHYIVRTAWLYHTAGRNFPKTMLSLSEKPEVRVVSDQYGSPTFAPHLAAAMGRLMETGAWGVYHLAGQGGTSWYDLTVKLYRRAGVRTAVQSVSTGEFPRPAPRPRYSVLTTIQSPEILLPPWEEGLAAFVAAL